MVVDTRLYGNGATKRLKVLKSVDGLKHDVNCHDARVQRRLSYCLYNTCETVGFSTHRRRSRRLSKRRSMSESPLSEKGIGE